MSFGISFLPDGKIRIRFDAPVVVEPSEPSANSSQTSTQYTAPLVGPAAQQALQEAVKMGMIAGAVVISVNDIDDIKNRRKWGLVVANRPMMLAHQTVPTPVGVMWVGATDLSWQNHHSLVLISRGPSREDLDSLKQGLAI